MSTGGQNAEEKALNVEPVCIIRIGNVHKLLQTDTLYLVLQTDTVLSQTLSDDPLETWLNVYVSLKDVNHAAETFTVKSYFNFFWKTTNLKSMESIEDSMTKNRKNIALKDYLFLDLQSIINNTDPKDPQCCVGKRLATRIRG